MAALGEQMRARWRRALSWLLADPSPDVQQMSLMILGNLCVTLWTATPP